MAIRKSVIYSNVPSFPSGYYAASSAVTAKTVSVAADRYKVSLPSHMDVDINGSSYQLTTQIYLDAGADASWDFGQDIATWQPNTVYSEGDWVRVTSAAMVDGKFNGSTDRATQLATSDTNPYILTYTSRYSALYPAYYALSGNLAMTNTWASSAKPTSEAPQSWMIDLGTGNAKTINKYLYFSGNVRGKTWTFEGTNTETAVVGDPIGTSDGSGTGGWKILDTQTNITASNGVWLIYTFSNSTAYRYYRFRFTDSSSANEVDISELILVASQTTLHNFVFKCTTAGTSGSSEPTWGTTVGGTTAESGGPTWTCYYDTTNPNVRAGSDYYIYACQPATGIIPKMLLSSNATYPHGYTSSNSRKIGGFHCLCGSVGTISNHPLTGYLTGDILPASVWCLKHRHASGDNRGMVYIEPLNKWAYIYNASGTQFIPVSAFGGTILDTITWFQGRDAASRVGMKLPTDAEFGVLAAGSNEGTNILGSADPVTVTAAVDTAGRRMISNYGVEGCCGVQKQWSDTMSYSFAAAAAHTHTIAVTGDAGTFTSGNPSADVAPAWTYKTNTNYKGSLYTQGTYGLIYGLLGAKYSDGSNAGSIALDMSIIPSGAYATVCLRFIGNNIEK